MIAGDCAGGAPVVEHYSSEQEQIETIKRWWKDNGTALVLGLVVGIGGLAGYRYWDASQTAQAEGASINYEMMLQLLNDRRIDDAEKTGLAVIENYPATPYARMSSLLLAKLAADEGEYDKAETLLRPLAEDAKDAEIQAIANARLARLALAQGDVTEAAKRLAAIPHAPERDEWFVELQADVLAAKGEFEQARAHYVKALMQAEKLGIDSSIIQLKLDNLSGDLVDAAP
jgi:predicted negative regulator of RcsB-dependent stress response